MRRLVIAAFAAIVTSSGCVRPAPQAPGEAPAANEPSSAEVEQVTPAPGTSSAAAAPPDESPLPRSEPTPNPERPTGPAAAAISETPPPGVTAPRAARRSAVVADTPSPPTAAPRRVAPREEPVVEPSESPSAASSTVAAAAPSAERSMPPVSPPAALPAQDASPAQSALDLAGLERRLRETQAIGVFTKLSLKNQVDDLLSQFRAFYRGQLKLQLTDLRNRYELLLFKVLTLLQDSDRELADAIAASREAIWGILTDPQKLAEI